LNRNTPPEGSSLFQSLLGRARDGDLAALGELWARSEARLRYDVNVKNCGHLDPEDVLQETFLRAWRGLSGFRGNRESSFIGWLRQIGRRTLSTSLRRSRVSSEHYWDVEACEQEQPAELRASALDFAERRRRFQCCLDELSERQRLAYVMRDLLGLDWAVLAAALKCPSQSAAVSLHARSKRQVASRMG